MRNIVLVHKVEGVKVIEAYVDVDRIVAIENATTETFKIYFECAIWIIDAKDYEELMKAWAIHYKFMNNKCFN